MQTRGCPCRMKIPCQGLFFAKYACISYGSIAQIIIFQYLRRLINTIFS